MLLKKLIIFLVAISVYGCASSEKIRVNVDKGHQCSGDIFPLDSPAEILFLERSCELPLANSDHMKAYSFRSKSTVINGCWEKNPDGSYLIVDQQGQQSTRPLWSYVDATLITPTTAKITFSPLPLTSFGKGMCP